MHFDVYDAAAVRSALGVPHGSFNLASCPIARSPPAKTAPCTTRCGWVAGPGKAGLRLRASRRACKRLQPVGQLVSARVRSDQAPCGPRRLLGPPLKGRSEGEQAQAAGRAAGSRQLPRWGHQLLASAARCCRLFHPAVAGVVCAAAAASPAPAVRHVPNRQQAECKCECCCLPGVLLTHGPCPLRRLPTQQGREQCAHAGAVRRGLNPCAVSCWAPLLPVSSAC